MSGWMTVTRGTTLALAVTAMLAAPAVFSAPCASADEYHTPLAGEPLHTEFMGEKVDVDARDRGHVTALTLGGTYYDSKQGSTTASPIAAFYIKRVWETSRTRDVISIFVNDLEYDKSFGNLELVGLLNNYTLPGGQKETLNNQEIASSSVDWGDANALLGPGLRFKVAPFQVDNDLRLQLLGKVGYFYVKKNSDSAPTMVVPPDTMLYGGKLRGRYDGMRRNILELPHTGFAAGFDLDYTYRDKWTDWGTPGVTAFTKKNTQDFLQFTGYLMGVTGIPWMSEKNRLLFSLHGGTMDPKRADRFNSFRIGGGPLQGESDDLARPSYQGTMFNNILVSNYAIGALEYRRELNFFMYGHLRGSYIWANRAEVLGGGEVAFVNDNGEAFSAGLDTGFFWHSSLYFEYTWDSGFIREGRPGSSYMVIWNESF
ncbi:MAG TPA: porin [Geobacteraceae bacterium]|nr:porin [Geobacteraceae bacterium]